MNISSERINVISVSCKSRYSNFLISAWPHHVCTRLIYKQTSEHAAVKLIVILQPYDLSVIHSIDFRHSVETPAPEIIPSDFQFYLLRYLF